MGELSYLVPWSLRASVIKKWQNYAAATAAAVTKGFLDNWNIGMQFQNLAVILYVWIEVG